VRPNAIIMRACVNGDWVKPSIEDPEGFYQPQKNLKNLNVTMRVVKTIELDK
jgi:hypothetical protein